MRALARDKTCWYGSVSMCFRNLVGFQTTGRKQQWYFVQVHIEESTEHKNYMKYHGTNFSPSYHQ